MGGWSGSLESVEVTSEFWRGRRVLLTGHTGFKGSWLSLSLQSLGASVTGYALEPSSIPSLFEVAYVAKGMHSIIGDVRDLVHLRRAMQESQPEIVIHMAAQSLVKYGYAHPEVTFETNVMGTVNVLEAVRGTPGIKAVVNVTSDKCYENREWHRGYREDDILGGYDPYSSSKACSELVTAAYRNSYFNSSRYAEHGVAVATARAGNVIGGGDWTMDRLIPDILRAITSGRDVSIRNPDAVRPWQHVLEPLQGYLLLAEALYMHGEAFSEAWNFGPGKGAVKPVRWIVERLTQAWGLEAADWRVDSGKHPHEARLLQLDSSKACERLNWRPRLSIDQALERIVVWHKAFDLSQDMRKITLEEIDDYWTLQNLDENVGDEQRSN